MDWTEERIASLRKMWQEGLSASQVARQLGGVSRNAVIGKVHRMGLAGRDAPARPRSLGGRPPTRVHNRPKMAPAIRRSIKRTEVILEPVQAAFEVEPSATILTLGEHACRWPIGDPETSGFGFCGRVRIGQGSYCAGHSQVAFRAKPKSARTNVAPDPWVRRMLAEEIPARYVAR
jgi:GcrA cell cycle regulator